MEETRRLIKEEFAKDFKDPLMLRVTQPIKNKVQEQLKKTKKGYVPFPSNKAKMIIR